MRVSPRFIKSLCMSPASWAGIMVSVSLHLLVAQIVEGKARNQFDYHAENARLAIENRMRSYIDVLHGVNALFYTTDKVTRKQFHAYVEHLDLERSFPGITSLNFAQRVFAHEKNAFEASVRNDTSVNGRGYPGFTVKPAAQRTEYHVMTYMEPETSNPASFGLDLAANKMVEKALGQSRDSGQLASSGRLIHVAGPNRHIGLAIRMPLYRPGMPLNTVEERRAAYYGSIGAGFDVSTLMLGAVDHKTLELLNIRLYDTGSIDQERPAGRRDPERLLFEVAAPAAGPAGAGSADPDDVFVRRTTMTVGQRVWEAEFSAPKSAMLNGFEAYLPWMVLIAGLAASVLLYGLGYLLATARRRALEMAGDMTRELRASEASLAEAQQMAHLGSWTLEPGSGKMTWSTETYRILGFRVFPDEPHYGDFLRRIYAQDRQRVREGLERSIAVGEEFDLEHRITQHDGTVRWVQTISRLGHDGKDRLLRGTIMDITERKSALDALTRSQELLRELTAYQDRIKEEERKRIAREIHDELGQTLLVLRIDVSMLDARTRRSHPRLNEKVRLALHHLDATVKTVRNIINNLRPAALDLGLNAAIEWQVAEFRRRTGITCDLLMSAHEFAVDDARATSLFRILQESLTNVTRHAKATHVVVELYQEQARLVMKIADNGVGIRAAPTPVNSFGLVGMEERVHALNGEFLIEGAPGKGTAITVHIPLHADDGDRPAAAPSGSPSGKSHPEGYCL